MASGDGLAKEWCLHRSREWPALQSFFHRCGSNTQRFRPLSNRLSLPHVFNFLVSPSVVCLNVLRYPSAVFRRIRAVIVDALQAVKRPIPACPNRTRTHVGEEVFKLQPTLANLNPAPTIQLVRAGAFSKTTVEHAGPNCAFRICASEPFHIFAARFTYMFAVGIAPFFVSFQGTRITHNC